MLDIGTIDPVLLAFGLARVAAWIAVAIIGYRYRRLLPCMFGGLASTTSVVFAVTNARGDLPGPLMDMSAVLALPIVLMILAYVIADDERIPPPRWLRMPPGWRL